MKFNINFSMKVLALLMLPFIGFGQNKNVITTHRVFPKIDKVLEFEKAIAAHAQKYHKGDATWRVFEIMSGPDFGGYHIVEGPTSWTALDSRGNLGDEHHVDWNKSVAPFLTERQSASYSVYQDTLSTVALGDFSEKINTTHIYPKIGMDGRVRKVLDKLQKAWAANGSTVAVYSVVSSGPAQYALTTRYKQGLKEREDGFRKPFRGVFDSVNGDDAFNAYLEEINECIDSAWSEMLVLRPDLGSKN